MFLTATALVISVILTATLISRWDAAGSVLYDPIIQYGPTAADTTNPPASSGSTASTMTVLLALAAADLCAF